MLNTKSTKILRQDVLDDGFIDMHIETYEVDYSSAHFLLYVYLLLFPQFLVKKDVKLIELNDFQQRFQPFSCLWYINQFDQDVNIFTSLFMIFLLPFEKMQVHIICKSIPVLLNDSKQFIAHLNFLRLITVLSSLHLFLEGLYSAE